MPWLHPVSHSSTSLLDLSHWNQIQKMMLLQCNLLQLKFVWVGNHWDCNLIYFLEQFHKHSFSNKHYAQNFLRCVIIPSFEISVDPYQLASDGAGLTGSTLFNTHNEPIIILSLLDTCWLLITFANSLDPDQDWQNVGPDLDPNCLSLIVFLKEFFEKR